jgi:hypothetical protein
VELFWVFGFLSIVEGNHKSKKAGTEGTIERKALLLFTIASEAQVPK